MVSRPFDVDGTSEAAWRDSGLFDGLDLLHPEEMPALVVVAAHPDDETLGAGGLLALAAELRVDTAVIIASNGEHSHPASPTHSPEQLAAVRRTEVLAAVSTLNPEASVLFLDLPDGQLADFEEDLVARIKAEIAPMPADSWILTPWTGDRHPDHEAVARATHQAGVGLSLRIFGYPIWAWHWAQPADTSDQGTSFPSPGMLRVNLTDSQLETKKSALAMHASQVESLSPADGDEAVVPPSMLEHFTRDFEVFIVDSGTPGSDSASLSKSFFDEFYGDHPDPWGFADRWYEKRKRQILLASLPRERFQRAFEPGCANGDLTTELALRCKSVLATEISSKARQRAIDKLSGRPNVQVESGQVPRDWPEGKFDLVVISEIGYYCGPADLEMLVERSISSLTADGVLALCHWRHEVQEYPLGGDDVHRAFRADSRLEGIAAHEESDFLLDIFMLRPAKAVAVATGLISGVEK